jgi:hypothetical protein
MDPIDVKLWPHEVERRFIHPAKKHKPGHAQDVKMERLGTYTLWLPFPPAGKGTL